ncbi:MAG: cyclic nucleotide-binding domain-containing protein [Ancalomicrobiaceae bacterium]|nr:cyclic nucleotide-binding domain-containing protein [Ancalomicrobiaceae bacterium]
MALDFFGYDGAETPPAVDLNKSILKGLGEEDWDKVLSFGALRRYPADSIVLKPGSREALLHFIVTGAIRLTAQGGREQRLLGEGNVFGLMSFLDGEPSTLEAVAEGPVELLLLGPEAFDQMAAWHPRIAISLLRDVGADLAGRLRRLADPI